MRIRQAAPEDMAHVDDPDPGSDASLLLNCGFGPDRWFECLVAEDGNRIVGFALFCRRFEAHTREKRVWVGDLCVVGNQRRHGIGRALVAAVRARAAELGCAAVDLELARGNDMARSFYEHLKGVVCDGTES